MKNKFNLDLKFLYQEPLIRGYSIGGGEDTEYNEWKNKYEEGENNFRSFIRQCSFEDLIYIYILVYKETFPNGVRLAYSIANTSESITDMVTLYKDFDRSDILTFKAEYFKGPINDEFLPEERDVYETKVILEFTNTFSIASVEEALQGLNYTTEVSEELTTYFVENSPIEKLEVTSKSFTIHLNKDKVILYYKM